MDAIMVILFKTLLILIINSKDYFNFILFKKLVLHFEMLKALLD